MDAAATATLVAGADRGPGRALALELPTRGATVYAGARDPDTVDLLDGGGVLTVPSALS